MAGDFSRLSYTYTEVLGSATDVAKATRLRNQFTEVVALFSNTTTDPHKSRLRYMFIEVIGTAPSTKKSQPQVMFCL